MAKRTSKPNRKSHAVHGAIVSPHGGRSFNIAQTDKFAAFLTSAQSFSFSRYANPVGDVWMITCRRERRNGGAFWYGYKSVEGKTYKIYIGQKITLETLKNAVSDMMKKVEGKTE